MFGCVGLFVLPLSWFRPGLARWVVVRISLALLFLALLLNVEGLYLVADLSLAGGLATIIGFWIGRRSDGFDRLVRVSFPALVVLTLGATGLFFGRVQSAEYRSLAFAPSPKPGAPNVVLIVLDTVRASCVDLHGSHRPTTPNLERLSRRGVVFNQAYSTAPWTSPSHASMLTGRWPHELSVAPGVPLDATFPTLAEVLGRQGYATAGFVGNIYYCNNIYGFGRGFSRFEDAYENQTVSLLELIRSTGLGRGLIQAMAYPRKLTDEEGMLRKTAEMLNRDILHWLTGRPSDRPFFAFVNYYDVHRPYVLPDDPNLRFATAGLPAAERVEIDRRFENLVAGEFPPPEFTMEQVSNQAMELYHDSYDSCIAYLDQQVGALLNELEQRGLLKNTYVIVTSDHGEQLGERGMIIHGASVYNQETHVPLMVIPPSGTLKSKIVDEPVSLRDIPATVAEWVGLEQNNPFPGRSLSQFSVEGTETRPEVSPAFSELQHLIAFPDPTQIPPLFGLASSLVLKEHAYILKEDGTEELYDLANDPLETVNIAAAPQSQTAIKKFRAELHRLHPESANPSH